MLPRVQRISVFFVTPNREQKKSSFLKKEKKKKKNGEKKKKKEKPCDSSRVSDGMTAV